MMQYIRTHSPEVRLDSTTYFSVPCLAMAAALLLTAVHMPEVHLGAMLAA